MYQNLRSNLIIQAFIFYLDEMSSEQKKKKVIRFMLL